MRALIEKEKVCKQIFKMSVFRLTLTLIFRQEVLKKLTESGITCDICFALLAKMNLCYETVIKSRNREGWRNGIDIRIGVETDESVDRFFGIILNTNREVDNLWHFRTKVKGFACSLFGTCTRISQFWLWTLKSARITFSKDG